MGPSGFEVVGFPQSRTEATHVWTTQAWALGFYQVGPRPIDVDPSGPAPFCVIIAYPSDISKTNMRTLMEEEGSFIQTSWPSLHYFFFFPSLLPKFLLHVFTIKISGRYKAVAVEGTLMNILLHAVHHSPKCPIFLVLSSCSPFSHMSIAMTTTSKTPSYWGLGRLRIHKLLICI